MMSNTPNPSESDSFSATNPAPGQVFQTALGERVEIIGYGDTKLTLKVRFPERDATPEVQMINRYSFANQANYEGYDLITEDGPTEDADTSEDTEDLPGEWSEDTPRCPICSAFMSTGTDGDGFPTARCSKLDCHGVMGVDELIDAGYFRED